MGRSSIMWSVKADLVVDTSAMFAVVVNSCCATLTTATVVLSLNLYFVTSSFFYFLKSFFWEHWTANLTRFVEQNDPHDM